MSDEESTEDIVEEMRERLKGICNRSSSIRRKTSALRKRIEIETKKGQRLITPMPILETKK